MASDSNGPALPPPFEGAPPPPHTVSLPPAPLPAPGPGPAPAPVSWPAAQPLIGAPMPSNPAATGGLHPPPNGSASYMAGSGPAPMQAPPHQPMQRKTKRALIASFISVGVVALLVVGGAIALSIMNQSRDPASVVEEYLALLADGKAEAATAMVDPDLSTNESVLLTDEVLAGAEARLVVISVETVSRGGGGAEVEAVMELAGDRFSHTFEVEHGPKEWLLLDTWVLEDSLIGKLFVGTDEMTGSATVSGVELTTGTPGEYRERTVYLYPGVYTVAGSESKYLTTASQSVTVWGPYEYAQVWLETETNAAFEKTVLEQINKLATACVTVPTNMASECPDLVRRGSLSTMELTVPATRLEYLSESSFESGRMTMGVRETSAAPGSDLRTEDVYVYGSIEWEDGEPVLTDYTFY